MKLKDKILFELIRFVRKSGHEVVIPNFYFGNYEMDLFRLLSSGFVHEYEVKTSRADWKADFNKRRRVNVGLPDIIEIGKHEEIQRGKYKANKFFFVVPAGLVSVDEIPEKCGLIYFHESEKTFSIVKPAKFLNKEPIRVDHQELSKKLCFREQNIRVKNYDLTNKIQQLKNKKK